MRQKGFSLVELVVAIAIFAVLVSGITFFAVGSLDVFSGTGDTREQERFARQAVEALEIIKERSWTEIVNNASDAPTSRNVDKNASGVWTLTTASTTIGSFTRGVYLYNVQRNSSGDIVASGGTDDPNTKRAVVLVSASDKSDFFLETYLTNWESFRMLQTSWGGDSADTSWTEGQDDYFSQTDMDLPTTSGNLSIDTT